MMFNCGVSLQRCSLMLGEVQWSLMLVWWITMVPIIGVWRSTGGPRSVKLLCYQGCLLRGDDIQTRKERREGLDWEVCELISGIESWTGY